MKHFLPHVIQENYRHGLLQGSLRAYTMFVDLSGFTSMTEKLMGKGAEGAEELSAILNHVFQPTVTPVYEQGGFIPYFAGDSFTAIFPTKEATGKGDAAVAAAAREAMGAAVLHTARATIQRFIKEQQQPDSLFAQHHIGIKIGLSEGVVDWGIVGNRRKGYYFRGAAIDGCAQAQVQAGSLEVVCDQAFLDAAPGMSLRSVALRNGYHRLNLDKIPEYEPGTKRVKLPKPDPAIATEFLPEEAFAEGNAGEFRNVVSVFLSFSGVDSHQALDHFAALVLDQSLNFGGYFKEIDFGDKGGLMFCIFGAPVSFENNTERALEFIAAVQEELQHLETLTGARYRIGISSGMAFTGVIGSPERCQYAAVGARVNLAARLMAKASWGEVVADDNVQHNRNFKFVFRGDEQYKGFVNKIPTYLLSGRNLGGRSSFTGEYYGRATELRTLQEFAAPVRDGRFAGVAFVYGEAGIGKSRLSYEFRRSMRDTMALSWFNCQSDQILRKPFNPFIYFLKNYFEQSPDNSPAKNQELFESNFLELMYDLTESRHGEADAIRREIARTQSILAALVGITYPGSLWEQLDARGRYQNALSAMANLFVAESILQPAVIELEDTHWYDDMSREFLAQFIRRAQGYPLFFLATSRYEDDGSKSYIFRRNVLQELSIPFCELDLNFLQPDDLRAFAEARLGGVLHADLIELLQRMTQGNPFYLEQMADYFQEADMLKNSGGVLQLKNQEIQVSDSVKQIMMARIDRLSGLVKETVKAAAVIGREFELPVLSAVMARQEEFARRNGDLDLVLKEQIQTAEKWQIWHAMNELRYIFRHSLLREAAYDMQLRTRLRELHQLIAEAIEHLYPNSEERFVDLAFHYEQAEVTKKTNKYLEKAAQYAQRNFLNRQALQYYGKLIDNLLEGGKKSKKLVKFLLRKGAVHELIGQWEESETMYRDGLVRAKALNDWYLIGRANRRLGQLLMLRGNYAEGKKNLDVAVTCFELANDQVGIAKTYGNLGTFFFRQGSYESAQSWFAKAIEINRSIQRDTENAAIVANLGLIFMNQGHYDEGIRWLEEQIDIAERSEDKQGLAVLYTNLGIIYLEKNSLDSALLCLEKGLALSEELGNKLYMTICIGSIGSVWEKKGDYSKAMEMFERDLALCQELGDKQGLAIASGLIGDLLSTTGDLDRSNKFLEENLALSRELNYKKGIAKALNTLGDNWFYKGDLDRSLEYYSEAIEHARAMGNRLVLGNSLVEKGTVHLHAGDVATARQLLEEGRDIGLSLGNAELTFAANVLRAQVFMAENNKQEALRQLNQLQSLARSEREEAAIHYELRKIANNPLPHYNRALTLYQNLHEQTPQYVYKLRLDELKKERQ
ncbi:MAG: tetratricopeptide repeat protein [Lewinellaceae bacterium]|nr:tetratricopeptide repeat protein [Saprospiraceae bacterium]MCB9333567.1 tetratricopeptide repeat protein [Lewinellaceae bacterium]